MTGPFLKSKLDIPGPRTRQHPRHQLLAQINAAKDYSTILVSAPAGYGKTALLSEWARSRKEQVVWISLEEADDDPVRFYNCLSMALKKWVPELAESDACITSIQATPIETTFTMLLNMLAELQQPRFIILDDYHCLKNRVIHDMIGFLVERLPLGVQFIISTRTDPPIPLERLRIMNQLCEIRQTDLCFSQTEVADFFSQSQGINLSPHDVSILVERTEGWIAGVYAAALYLGDCADKTSFIANFSGNHNHIMDYLVREVFFRQPEAIRTFLMESAILDHLTASLCDAVTERTNSAALLDSLVVQNQFIVQMDNQRCWYRYHHLFSDVLRNLLHQQSPNRIPRLYRKAAQWYEQNRHPDEAIRYAFKCGDKNYAAALIEKFALQVFNHGERLTIRHWIEQLDNELINTRPSLCLVHAWSIMNDKTTASDELFQLRLNQAQRVISDTLATNDAPPTSESFSAPLVTKMLTMLNAIFAFERGKPVEHYLERLRRSLHQTDYHHNEISSAILYLMAHIQLRTWNLTAAFQSLNDTIALARYKGNLYLTAYATYLRAWIQFQRGKLHQALQISQDSQAELQTSAHASGTPLLISGALQIISGAVYLEWNRLEDAERTLRTGLNLLNRTTESGIIINGLVHLLRTTLARQGDSEEIKALITRLEIMGRFHEHAAALAEAIQMDLSHQVGNRPLLNGQLNQLERRFSFDTNYFSRDMAYYQDYDWYLSERLILIRLVIHHSVLHQCPPSQTLEEAIHRFLRHQLAGAKRWGLVNMMIKVQIAQAGLYEVCKARNKAVTCLEHALSLAAPEGAIRGFVEQGPVITPLLKHLKNQGHFIHFIDRIMQSPNLAKGSPSTANATTLTATHSMMEPLSDRELEVLRLIADGDSNREIAAKLFISINTVKFHISRVYDKLGVNKRTQAVSQANHLGIF